MLGKVLQRRFLVIGYINIRHQFISRSVMPVSVQPHAARQCFPVHHQLLELVQTHVYRASSAIQSPHPLSSPFPPAFNLSQHQSLFQ